MAGITAVVIDLAPLFLGFTVSFRTSLVDIQTHCVTILLLACSFDILSYGYPLESYGFADKRFFVRKDLNMSYVACFVLGALIARYLVLPAVTVLHPLNNLQRSEEPSRSRPSLQLVLLIASLLTTLWWWNNTGLSALSAAVDTRTTADIVLTYVGHSVLLCTLLIIGIHDHQTQYTSLQPLQIGTLFACIWAALFPQSLPAIRPFGHTWMHACYPLQWPACLNGPAGAAIGVVALAVTLISFHLSTDVLAQWYLRRGLGPTLRVCSIRVIQIVATKRFVLIMIAAAIAMSVVWQVSAQHWQALLTAITGYAVAYSATLFLGALMTAVLKRYALGSGDSLMLGMCAAFIGWQATLITLVLGSVYGIFYFVALWSRKAAFLPPLAAAAMTVACLWPLHRDLLNWWIHIF